MVRHRPTNTDEWRADIRQSSGTALAVGLVAGALMMLGELLLPEPTRGALLAMGAVVLLLLLQDSWRFRVLRRRPRLSGSAQRSRLGVALIPALILVVRAPDPSAFGFVLALGVCRRFRRSSRYLAGARRPVAASRCGLAAHPPRPGVSLHARGNVGQSRDSAGCLWNRCCGRPRRSWSPADSEHAHGSVHHRHARDGYGHRPGARRRLGFLAADACSPRACC